MNQAVASSHDFFSRKRRRVELDGITSLRQPIREGGSTDGRSKSRQEKNVRELNLQTADVRSPEHPTVVAQDSKTLRAFLNDQHVMDQAINRPVNQLKVNDVREVLPRSSHNLDSTVLPLDHAPQSEVPRLDDITAWRLRESTPEISYLAPASSSDSVPQPGDVVYSAEPSRTSDLVEDSPSPNPVLRASKVPSSRIGRFFHYGGLAASLSYGAASEILRRSSLPTDAARSESSSLLMTEANLNRLVSKLTQMRGAALKLGQFLSIQDSHVLPEELERVFRRVQDGAHYMPNWQMENVMSSSLGPSWRSHFSDFTSIPSHSASIGQVHHAVLTSSSSSTGKEEEVVVKIQFPDIARSISSDLGYLKLLLGASTLLPKGLFLDRTLKVFKAELADECDYGREADCIRKFRSLSFIKSDNRYRVPWVWNRSTDKVLVMERMEGVSVGGEIVKSLTQNDRDEIAARVIELCLRELFEFRMMQTDPNWTNFLWNQHTRQQSFLPKMELIDFGATREYSKDFIDNWSWLLAAAVRNDREACIKWSRKLGYLIGGENEVMVTAHLKSMQLLGTPFRSSTHQPFSFARGSAWTKITEDIRAQIPVMLKNRLTPPPRETYSLNRKLSGAFLLAARLGASVDCRLLWENVLGTNFGQSN